MARGSRLSLTRLRRLRELKRLRLKRRHWRTALMATTPTAALLGLTTMPVAKVATPVAIAATVAGQDALAAATPKVDVDPPLTEDQELVEASFYGAEFAGRPTASGEEFDPTIMTAAHRTLPFGSFVLVTEALTGKSVTVRINDRGPFHGDRVIDVSHAAAEQIGLVASGTGKVVLRVLSQA